MNCVNSTKLKQTTKFSSNLL